MTMNLPQVAFYFDIKISPDVEMTRAVSFRPTGGIFNLRFINSHFMYFYHEGHEELEGGYFTSNILP